MLLKLRKPILKYTLTVIFLPAHPASFAHTFVSKMQSFHFSESQDAMVLQTCHETNKFAVVTHCIMGNSESQDL